MKKMIIEGTYNKASVFASIVETEALKQIEEICNQPFTEGSHIAVMPDVHSGKGCTIGLTMTLGNKICPNLVGVDIGCGMMVVELGNIEIDFKKLDDVIRTYIPSGIDCRNLENIEELSKNLEYKSLIDTVSDILDNVKTPINKNYELYRIASLGSGNHFIEVDADSEGNKYLIIHSGSRHLGVSICQHYMEVANENRKGSLKEKEQKIKDMINLYKATGRQKEIQSEIKHINDTFVISEPSDIAYIEGKDYEDYLHDMEKAQKYADINRELMALLICNEMGWKRQNTWTTRHNYIDLERNILRKGAISLEKDSIELIPGSMKFGSLIVKGKGNKEANFSGPHGFGRLMSRSKAKETLKIEDFKNTMDGIYTTCISTSTIDEAPMAYKPAESIIPNIESMCEIISHIYPIYNFKSSN